MKLEERFRVTENDHLELYGRDLVDLCNKYGTPLFVFDERCFRENYRRFRSTFEENYPKTIVCYSIKANYNLTLCTIMRQEGAYAQVQSGLDLYVAKRAGFQADHIVFGGSGKSEKALREAICEEVLLINVESLSELERINKIAGEIGLKQAIGIRVNFFRKGRFINGIHRSISRALYCNPDSRFGFSLENAYLAFKRASKLGNIQVKGISTHPYHEAVASIPLLFSFIKRIQNELGIQLQYLNFGGGFRSNSSIGLIDLAKDFLRQKIGLKSKLDEKKKDMSIEKISKLIADAVKKQLIDIPEPTIVFEPGHYIVNDAGILFLRVECLKEASGYKWIIVDGGKNLIWINMERREIRVANRASAPPAETVNVVGRLQSGGDFIAIKKHLPRIEEGDILAVLNSGAYTLSFSNQFLYPRPSVILLDRKGEIKEIRKKEAYDDVLCMDKVIETRR